MTCLMPLCPTSTVAGAPFCERCRKERLTPFEREKLKSVGYSNVGLLANLIHWNNKDRITKEKAHGRARAYVQARKDLVEAKWAARRAKHGTTP